MCGKVNLFSRIKVKPDEFLCSFVDLIKDVYCILLSLSCVNCFSVRGRKPEPFQVSDANSISQTNGVPVQLGFPKRHETPSQEYHCFFQFGSHHHLSSRRSFLNLYHLFYVSITNEMQKPRYLHARALICIHGYSHACAFACTGIRTQAQWLSGKER